MKKILPILISILVFACTTNDLEIVEETKTQLTYTLRHSYEPYDVIHTKEYVLGDNGKVLSENYTSITNPQYSYSSTFEYNENGQIIRELRDGETKLYVKWSGNTAEVFNYLDIKINEFVFADNRPIEHKRVFDPNNIQVKKFNYDTDGNVISIENETEVFLEFLNYDLDSLNPFYLIKSIGILKTDHQIFFKNVFGVEKVYGYEADDFTMPTNYYDYYYELDVDNRIIEIENDKNLIYTQVFEYE